MTPSSILARVGVLSLFLLQGVSAASVCTQPGLSNTVCGVRGSINNFDNFIQDLFQPQYLSPEGCAQACFDKGNCVSFYLNTDSGGFCELHSVSTQYTGFVADSTSYYTAYNLNCFFCTVAPTPTPTPSSSSTSSESTSSSVRYYFLMM